MDPVFPTNEPCSDIGGLTSGMANFKLEHQINVDERSDPNANSYSVPSSRTFILTGMLDNEDSDQSVLEVYKDILNEKMNSKSKIPTPCIRKQSKNSNEQPPLYRSKLPLSVKLTQNTPNKRNSMVPLRSVSDSPSKGSNHLFSSHNARPSDLRNVPKKPTHASYAKRRVHSMILSSNRLPSIENSKPAQIPETPPNKRVSSYSRATTSSSKKGVTNQSLQDRMGNKENYGHYSAKSLLSLSDQLTPVKVNTRKQGELAPVSHHAYPNQYMGGITIVEQASTPKLRVPKNRERVNALNVSTTTSSMVRSSTHGNLNSNHSSRMLSEQFQVRKLSSSMEKRKVSTGATGQHDLFLRANNKLISTCDLYQTLGKSSLVKAWEKTISYKFSKVAPISPKELINNSRFKMLNNFERSEVLRRNQVYYVGNKSKPEIHLANVEKNFGFDDKDDNYIIDVGDHICYRYRVLSVLGQGAFGTVVSCNDYKSDKICAVKIVKNEMTSSLQAVSEVKILKQLSILDPSKHNVVAYYNHFHFRGHMCITTEFLPINLYQVLELSDFRGFDIPVISLFASQILNALNFLHKHLSIIHCDLKPENLMLTSPRKFELKLIDFGSAVPINEISFSYLQSRFYRAPEVTMGARYDEKIDIWSFACILVELYTGTPLFACESEEDLFMSYFSVLGTPDPALVQKLRKVVLALGPVGEKFNENSLLWSAFDNKGKLKYKIGSSTKNLDTILQVWKCTGTQKEMITAFVDMVECCLQWDYSKRSSAESLQRHRFVARK